MAITSLKEKISNMLQSIFLCVCAETKNNHRNVYICVFFVVIFHYLIILKFKLDDLYKNLKNEEIIFDSLLFFNESFICCLILLTKYFKFFKNQQLFRLLSDLQLFFHQIPLTTFFIKTFLLFINLLCYILLSNKYYLSENILTLLLFLEILLLEIILTSFLQTVKTLVLFGKQSIKNYLKVPSQEVQRFENGDFLITGWFYAILECYKMKNPVKDIKYMSQILIKVYDGLSKFNEIFIGILLMMLLNALVIFYQNLVKNKLITSDLLKLFYFSFMMVSFSFKFLI